MRRSICYVSRQNDFAAGRSRPIRAVHRHVLVPFMALLVVSVAHVPSWGGIIHLRFEGRVGTVIDTTGNLPAGIVTGADFSGELMFDPSAYGPDANPETYYGTFQPPTGVGGGRLQATIGGVTITADDDIFTGVFAAIDTINNHFNPELDSVSVTYRNEDVTAANFDLSPYAAINFGAEWFEFDAALNPLDSDALPSSAELADLSRWEPGSGSNFVRLRFDGFANPGLETDTINLIISRIENLSAVPEPSSWALLLTGGMALVGLGRRRPKSASPGSLCDQNADKQPNA